jgi:hypothetical protein
VDLETFLISLYMIVDEWWSQTHPQPPGKPGRPAQLTDAEVLTLAVLSQWPSWRSERDFCRFADLHLREYFPNLLSQSQLNRRIRALEPELRAFQRHLAKTLCEPSEVYHVLDTTVIPAVVRVRACRKGLFAGQAAFGRCSSLRTTTTLFWPTRASHLLRGRNTGYRSTVRWSRRPARERPPNDCPIDGGRIRETASVRR